MLSMAIIDFPFEYDDDLHRSRSVYCLHNALIFNAAITSLARAGDRDGA